MLTVYYIDFQFFLGSYILAFLKQVLQTKKKGF